MDLRLFSIEQLPPTVPVWDLILEDLGRPHADRIARALQVGRSTVYRWNADRHAPRAAQLALFWLTRWGRSAVHTQATNDAILAAQLVRSLSEERDQLRAQLKHEPGNEWPPIIPPAPWGDASILSNAAHLLKKGQAHPLRSAFFGDNRPTGTDAEHGQAADMARGHEVGHATPSHAGGHALHAAPAALRSQPDARPGTPASASVASLPSHGGYRPHAPAWSEPLAAPGRPAFDAIATACTTPTKTPRSRP